MAIRASRLLIGREVTVWGIGRWCMGPFLAMAALECGIGRRGAQPA